MGEDLQNALAMPINAAFIAGRSVYINTDARSVISLDMANGSVTLTRRATTREALQMSWSERLSEHKTGRWQHPQILDIEELETDMERAPHAPPTSISIEC